MSFDIFCGIVTAFRSAGFRGIRRLTVEDACGRSWLFTLDFTHQTTQGIVNFLPDTGVSPMPKYIVNGFPFREITGQISTLAPGAYHISDGVDHLPPINLFWSFFLFWNEFFDDLPLLFSQVRGIISFHGHVMLLRD